MAFFASMIGNNGSNQKDFLFRFFNQFHAAHDNLVELGQFSRESLNDESYLAEALATGLPNDFESPSKDA